MNDARYLRWRSVIGKPLWAVDRHWYQMLGWLHAFDSIDPLDKVFSEAPRHLATRPEYAAPDTTEADFGEVKPDGG